LPSSTLPQVIIDLHGCNATPGLIDTHAHIAEGGVEVLYGVKLSDLDGVPRRQVPA